MSGDTVEPAFPVISDILGHCHGMTLRQYYAAKALSNLALKSDGEYSQNDRASGLPEAHALRIAKSAFRYADAMIAIGGDA